jgi:hypothetical protein
VIGCAALLPERVTRCGVGAGTAPAHAEGVDFFGRLHPGRGQAFRLALDGEEKLRAALAEAATSIMAAVAAGGQEILPEPGEPAPPQATQAIDDSAAMACMPRAHSDWLAANIPAAQRFDYDGWHVPGEDVLNQIFTWLHG